MRSFKLGLGVLILLGLLGAGTAVAGETVLLDFYADWCGPCKGMAPTVDALVQEDYAVQRVNVDRDKELAIKYRVTSLPCFIVIEDGKEVDRVVGATTAERLKLKLHRRPHRKPHPAWRYEHPKGHRAAVVRIYCQDKASERSIGSGTLVRWHKCIAVLTARHVVQDAKKIIVELHTKKAYNARVLKLDAVWDCAVLELDGKPEGVEPVEVEMGEAAMQQKDARLESCGYGPDGKLACNSGLFLSYRRSSEAKNGPDDWMEISGHARSGDSGGPIFNEQGHLVGVLWGTDGEHVVGVQAGRVHRLLEEAIPAGTEPKAAVATAVERKLSQSPPACAGSGCCPINGPATTEQCAIDVLVRTPTPPVSGSEPATKPAQTMSDPVKQDSAKQIFGRKPIPQPPQVIVQPDPQVRQALSDIDAKLGVLVQERQQPQQVPLPPAEETSKSGEPSPLLAGLCIIAAVVLGFVVYFATSKN